MPDASAASRYDDGPLFEQRVADMRDADRSKFCRADAMFSPAADYEQATASACASDETI